VVSFMPHRNSSQYPMDLLDIRRSFHGQTGINIRKLAEGGSRMKTNMYLVT